MGDIEIVLRVKILKELLAAGFNFGKEVTGKESSGPCLDVGGWDCEVTYENIFKISDVRND